MYAIVRTGGKQYQVSPGDIIQVESLNAAQGDEVTLNEVLLVKDGEQINVGAPLVANSSVKAKVLNHGRGKKVVIFKFKKRKRYRLTKGHRQNFTRIQIQEIVRG